MYRLTIVSREIWLTIKELGEWRVAVCSIMWTQALFLPSMVSTYVATFFNTRYVGLLCSSRMRLMTS